jgi:hypothetical protein
VLGVLHAQNDEPLCPDELYLRIAAEADSFLLGNALPLELLLERSIPDKRSQHVSSLSLLAISLGLFTGHFWIQGIMKRRSIGVASSLESFWSTIELRWLCNCFAQQVSLDGAACDT